MEQTTIVFVDFFLKLLGDVQTNRASLVELAETLEFQMFVQSYLQTNDAATRFKIVCRKLELNVQFKDRVADEDDVRWISQLFQPEDTHDLPIIEIPNVEQDQVAESICEEKIQSVERDRVGEINFEEVIASRAERLRQEEPAPLSSPNDTKRVSTDQQRANADRARIESDWLAERTRLIETMNPDQAKEVIRRFWLDGGNQRVLQILMAMEERPRERILSAMQESDEEAWQDLRKILQRIGNGEPMRSILDDVSNNPDTF